MIDLHLHLDGSLSPESVIQLADCANIPLPCDHPDSLRAQLQVTPDCRNLGEYLEKFDLPLQVLQTEETLCLAVYLLLKQLSNDGLCYAEIRFAPQLHLAEGLTQQQVVAAAVRGLEKGIAEFPISAQLILCCMRGDTNRKENLETVHIAKQFLHKGVCAVDLAGNEAAYPTKDFADIFADAKALGIPYILHAGEAAGAESINQALKLGAQRIGHGVHAIEDTDCMRRLRERKIPLELCFTSNLQTKAVNTTDPYPLSTFLTYGIPVTINTDNMTVSGTNLRKEYLRLQAALSLSADTLKAIACNAVDAAFVTPEKASRLKAQIADGFEAWLKG